MPHLFGLQPEDLVACLLEQGESMSVGEARRVLAHVVGNGNHDLLLKKPISHSLQNKIKECVSTKPLVILERIQDANDNSVRYLFEAHDGALIEAVRIGLHKPGHFSVCISSQVGCAMACDFCATGRLGYRRNLEAWEIVAQVWQIKNETEGHLTGAVFMGQGEPFHNYDEVMHAAKIISSPTGLKINSKNITISTVGLVPQIERFTSEKQPYRLIVSLTSAIDSKRRDLVPVAGGWKMDELARVIRDYSIKQRERVTLAWVLIQGVNTGSDEVEALKFHFGETKIKLNLIDVNDKRENGYARASDEERKHFMALLQELKIPIVRRYSVGHASNSACGMLAAARKDTHL